MTEEHRTRTLIGPADPARGVAVPPPRLSTADIMARAGTATPGRPNRRLVLAAAAGTAVVVAGGTAAVSSLTRRGQESPQRTSAGLVLPIAYQVESDPPPAGSYLRALASRIVDAPYDRRTGRYAYHHTKSWGDPVMTSEEGYVMSWVEERKTWTDKDGAQRIRQLTLEPMYPDEESRRFFERKPAKPSGDPEDFTVPGNPKQPYKTPTSRAELARWLGVHDGPGAVAKFTNRAFTQYVVPRQTRAAILELLADVRGFVWRGEVTDRAGRPGVAITAKETGKSDGMELLLIFDPKTGTLLADEHVLPASKRKVVGYQLVLATDRTDQFG